MTTIISTSYTDHKKKMVAVFENTISIIENNAELQKAVKNSILYQEFISNNDCINCSPPSYVEEARVIVSRFRSFEAAAKYSKQKVAVLNFASATSPGGGVRSGAMAQEGSLCRVSTLYPCLMDKLMWEKFYSPHRISYDSLHNDDIIYTPNVVVIKDDDYNMLKSPFLVDIITCAAPNLRPNPSNGNACYSGDAVRISHEDLLLLHEKRAKKILSVAAQKKVEVLILGAFGCGAFCNDPNVVATAYHNMIPEFLNCFKTIEFAIYCSPNNPQNFLAFRKVFDPEL